MVAASAGRPSKVVMQRDRRQPFPHFTPTMMYSSKNPLSFKNRTADSGVNSFDRNSHTLMRSRNFSACSGSAISRKGSRPWTSQRAGGSPFCERASNCARTNSPIAQSSNPSMTGPVRRFPVKNTLRRGTTRPVSSTSPSNAASSTEGKHNASGRIVDLREGTVCTLKTLFRMRNLNSTMYCLLDAFHNPLCCLSRESRTDAVHLVEHPVCRLRRPPRHFELTLRHDDIHGCGIEVDPEADSKTAKDCT